jgi:gliding motility-associated-like protein
MINVSVNNITIAVTSNATTCGNNNGSATVIPSGGNGPYNFSWNTIPVQTTATAVNLASGSYTISVTDANNCSETQTVSVGSSIGVTASASGVNTTCGINNGSATTIASGGNGAYTYSWNTNPVQTTQTISGLSPGIYIVTINSNGCSTSATATVGNSNALNVSINGSNNICSGSSTVLTASASGATNFSWNTIPVQFSSSINVSPSSTTTYTVTATDGGTCTGSASITVSVANKPNINISGDNLICLGESTTLTANGIGNHVWTPTGSTNNSIIVSPTASTVFYLDFTNGNPPGCNTDRDSITVRVGGQSGFINAGSDQTITIGQSATLIATGSNNFYVWSTNQVANAITVSPSQTTSYTVFSQDNLGCRAYDTVVVNVEIKCGEIFVPSGFSPNNDGSNDLECVYGNCIKTIYWAIYNRWGEKVYETSDKQACWDGTYKGQLMNTDVFVYKLQAELIDGKQVLKNGNIMITR